VRRYLAILLGLVGLAPAPLGCSADVSDDLHACTPGASFACACDTGARGHQACSPDGASLGSCVCGEPSTSTSAVGASTGVGGASSSSASSGVGAGGSGEVCGAAVCDPPFVCCSGGCQDYSDGGTRIILSPGAPSTSFSADLVAPGYGNHDWSSRSELDVSAFTTGGTIQISGVLGATGCEASFDLFPDCAPYATGPNTDGNVVEVVNIVQGASWMMSYTFAPTPVFHLGGEGNWTSPQGQTNTSSVDILVTPM
jgi:hypothetical protein